MTDVIAEGRAQPKSGRNDVTDGSRNLNLDALRAIAVALVILSHVPPPPASAPAFVTASLAWFKAYGGLGVDLFFVLSGFLVSGLLFREHISTGGTKIGRFLIRRGFKIYPAFYFFLVSTLAIRAAYGDHLLFRDVVAESLFVQNYGPHVWSHTWSLAVEEHFYLLLALLVLALQRRGSPRPYRTIPLIFMVVTVGVTIARAVTFAALPYSNYTHRFPTHLELDSLLFGVVLSYWFHFEPAFRTVVYRRAWSIVGLGILLVVLGNSLSAPAAYIGGHPLTYAGFGALVLGAVARPVGRLLRAGISVAAAVGRHSYSIYLWHAAVLAFGRIAVARLFGARANYWEIDTGYMLASVAVGISMAKAIEWPVLRLRDRLFPGNGSPNASQTGETGRFDAPQTGLPVATMRSPPS